MLMARSRNIKPAFFSDDELADHPPLARLFFIGSWCHADCNGNIEWRPKKLKAVILPYDDADLDSIAINLDKSGFIRFYSDGDKIYFNITGFSKHQNPHKNERAAGSSIPKYSDELRQAVDLPAITINRDLSGLNQDEDGTDRADSLNLIPDSLNLIPDSSVSGQEPEKPKIKKKSEPSPDDLNIANQIYADLKAINPNHKQPNLRSWANTIRLMRERDKKTLDEISQLWTWANTHQFWSANILSPAKLREQWDKLTIQKAQNGTANPAAHRSREYEQTGYSYEVPEGFSS